MQPQENGYGKPDVAPHAPAILHEGQGHPQGGGVSDVPLREPPSPFTAGVLATAATPPQANDTDLIEGEWVQAVKQVIADNREDPYALCKALIALKADYMRKRYGVDIKIPE